MELVAESSDERRKIRMKELQEEENSNIEYIIKLFENLTLIQQSIIIDYAELFIEENYRNTLKKRAQFKRMQNEQKMSRKMNNEGSDESDNWFKPTKRQLLLIIKRKTALLLAQQDG